ncbi:hypothetical protein AMAG_19812 [Allomyces macrogynus ATCC 38327]|uniref:Uncharacterized protein n=1 Tax=Allomyces macrogynus (strain ATCC 38327) TaxID=578462 RepID=A0A0L0SZK5_ALLM3|nr:hypothetical protein AMAG_19812 [Allomyces macrogynus ATCC 38327]|eukprot:KNE67942.1 hypothetical protein AMAG_19812 [Allomyces macrogynus ATCC 38327]
MHSSRRTLPVQTKTQCNCNKGERRKVKISNRALKGGKMPGKSPCQTLDDPSVQLLVIPVDPSVSSTQVPWVHTSFLLDIWCSSSQAAHVFAVFGSVFDSHCPQAGLPMSPSQFCHSLTQSFSNFPPEEFPARAWRYDSPTSSAV